jgi:hypothetical protein
MLEHNVFSSGNYPHPFHKKININTHLNEFQVWISEKMAKILLLLIILLYFVMPSDLVYDREDKVSIYNKLHDTFSSKVGLNYFLELPFRNKI